MKGVAFDGFKRLRFESMSFVYETGGPLVFEDFTADLPLGKNVFVTGSAGSGQSTLLKILAVLVQPQSGRYYINEFNTTEMSLEEFLPIRLKIGYSFDLGGLMVNRTLRENLMLPLLYHKICGDEEAAERARKLAEEFGFKGQLDMRPAMVSGGLRKLITVLRAFILRPEMAILDDPFTGIGIDAARKVVRLIHERRETGELKHVFLTSRDGSWIRELDCVTLAVGRHSIELQEERAAS